MRLTNKTALVTGASRGIGRAIALELAREGVSLVLHYHGDDDGARGVLSEVLDLGARAVVLSADFRDLSQVQRLGAEAWEAFGGIDFLVNNAGVSWKKDFLDQGVEDVDAFTDVNFKAPLYLTQDIARRMVASGRTGSICSITSINGIRPGPGHSVYGATKGALETLMKGLALELAPHGITVNTVAPGGIQTDINAAVWKDASRLEQVSANIPLGRLGMPEEVAAVAVNLLASSSYVTGATVVVDGGWLLNKLKSVLIFLIFTGLFVCRGVAQKLEQPWYIFERGGAQHVDLSGAWSLSYDDSSFVTTVPNSVQWSLYEAGKLPHPYYHKNADLYKWTDEKVWTYKKKFSLSAAGLGGNYVFLCFDGIDYFSRLWVNDSLIGDHEGMFGGPNVEISKYLHAGGENEIVVQLRAGDWGNKAGEFEKLPRNANGEYDISKRTGFNPRSSGRIIKPWVISGGSGCEMFFSLGMWQGVRLEIVPREHLERPFMTTKAVTAESATLHLSTELFVRSHSLLQQLHVWKNTTIRQPAEKGFPFVPAGEGLSLEVAFYSGDRVVHRVAVPLKLFEGRNWVEQDIKLANPKLWNPVGLGSPSLYKVRLMLSRGGKVIDELAFDYGIRIVDRVPSAAPRNADAFTDWQFVVNGKKIFLKGMDLTLQDVLLKTSEPMYRWTLTAAKEMGVQLVRIWGGGLIETNSFYRLCDSLGIMVWQDFPIGNQDTPEYPQDIWEDQVVQNICRLRNHPSLVVWCGGNEFNPYSVGNTASIGIVERNFRIFDNSRMFVRTSPDEGSIHTYPDMDPCWYDRSYGHEPFVAETGMHSMPEAGLFRELVSSKELSGLGRMWAKDFADAHPEFIEHFTEYGPNRVPRMLSRASHIDDMSDPSIESISEASQVGAGEFYQILSEKLQGNYPVTTGLVTWVFKRHWPVIAIQMMDWFGHAGAPYYFLKRTYEPTHVAVGLSRLLWAAGEKIALPVKVSNAGGALAGGKISVSVYDDGFRQVYQRVLPVSLASGASVTAVDAGSFAVPVGYSDRFLFVLAELRDGAGRLISRSWYQPRVLALMSDKTFYDKYVSGPIAWPTLDKGPWLKPSVSKTQTSLAIAGVTGKVVNPDESEVRLTIRNTGKLPAFMTQMDILDVKRAFFASDNFFWLAPGESKNVTIHVIWRDKSHRARLQVGAWNASAVTKSIEP